MFISRAKVLDPVPGADAFRARRLKIYGRKSTSDSSRHVFSRTRRLSLRECVSIRTTGRWTKYEMLSLTDRGTTNTHTHTRTQQQQRE